MQRFSICLPIEDFWNLGKESRCVTTKWNTPLKCLQSFGFYLLFFGWWKLTKDWGATQVQNCTNVQRIMKKAVVTTSIDTTTTTSKKDELQRYRLSKWFIFILHLFSWFSLSYCLICRWHRRVLEMKQLPDKRSLNRRLSQMLKTNRTQPVSH